MPSLPAGPERRKRPTGTRRRLLGGILLHPAEVHSLDAAVDIHAEDHAHGVGVAVKPLDGRGAFAVEESNLEGVDGRRIGQHVPGGGAVAGIAGVFQTRTYVS